MMVWRFPHEQRIGRDQESLRALHFGLRDRKGNVLGGRDRKRQQLEAERRGRVPGTFLDEPVLLIAGKPEERHLARAWDQFPAAIRVAWRRACHGRW